MSRRFHRIRDSSTAEPGRSSQLSHWCGGSTGHWLPPDISSPRELLRSSTTVTPIELTAQLLLYNLTTVEQIRASASSNLLKATKRPDNPFAADSILSNVLLSTLGRPQFPSWVQGWKVVQPERRTVNPALTEERWVKMGYDKGMR